MLSHFSNCFVPLFIYLFILFFLSGQKKAPKIPLTAANSWHVRQIIYIKTIFPRPKRLYNLAPMKSMAPRAVKAMLRCPGCVASIMADRNPNCAWLTLQQGSLLSRCVIHPSQATHTHTHLIKSVIELQSDHNHEPKRRRTKTWKVWATHNPQKQTPTFKKEHVLKSVCLTNWAELSLFW